MPDTTFALRVVLLSSFAITACNNGCGNGANPADAAPYEIVSAFPNLTFTRPVDLQNAGDGSDRLFVVEQAGRILVFLNNDTTMTSEVASHWRHGVARGDCGRKHAHCGSKS